MFQHACMNSLQENLSFDAKVWFSFPSYDIKKTFLFVNKFSFRSSSVWLGRSGLYLSFVRVWLSRSFVGRKLGQLLLIRDEFSSLYLSFAWELRERGSWGGWFGINLKLVHYRLHGVWTFFFTRMMNSPHDCQLEFKKMYLTVLALILSRLLFVRCKIYTKQHHQFYIWLDFMDVGAAATPPVVGQGGVV